MKEIEDFIRVINKLDNICENDIIKAQKEKLLKQDKEIERLHSIIKEAREYITTIKEEDLQYTIGWIKLDLLEILDKVEENTNGKD